MSNYFKVALMNVKVKVKNDLSQKMKDSHGEIVNLNFLGNIDVKIMENNETRGFKMRL